jgi:hypothetical protein
MTEIDEMPPSSARRAIRPRSGPRASGDDAQEKLGSTRPIRTDHLHNPMLLKY